jgi:hypothetical protein
MTTEDRLRELLQDPRWSLPAWPDPQARVRRAARRQRLSAASFGAAVAAFVTTAAVIPVVLLGRLAPGGAGPGSDTVPVAGAFQTPAVGAVGFDAAVYPAAVKAQSPAGVTTLCPDPAGLQAFGRQVAAAPLKVLHRLAQVQLSVSMKGAAAAPTAVTGPARAPVLTIKQGYAASLPLSDRAFWPQLPKWRTVLVQAARVPVIYSGPLRSYPSVHGPPGLARVAEVGCGSRVAMNTWVIVSGRPANPATEAETFFVNRRGHVLLYKASSA